MGLDGRIERLGGQHRKDVIVEMPVQPVQLPGRDLRFTKHRHSGFTKLRAQARPDLLLAAGEPVDQHGQRDQGDDGADEREAPGRGVPLHRPGQGAGAGDPAARGAQEVLR